MSNKLEDKDIDRLFRDSIDTMETEPSDHFWNKAYDGILQKETQNYERKIFRWKGISYCLAAAVVALICYNIYTGQKVSYVEQQISNIEKKQSEVSSNEVVASNSAKRATSVNSDDQIEHTSGGSPSANTNGYIQAQKTAALSNNASGFKSISKGSSQPFATQKSFASNGPISNSANYGNQPPASPLYANVLARAGNSVATTESRTTSNIIYLENKPTELRVTQSLDNAPLAQLAIIADTTSEALPIEKLMPIEAKKNYISKMSVSAFYAKSAAFPVLKYNGPNVAIPGDLSSSESEEAAYSFGLNMGYDISSRFTLQLGCNYRMYAFAINNTTVNPIIGESGPYYALVSTAGVINLPYIPGASTNPPTSATAMGNVKYSSVGIPLRLKVNFHIRKFRLYAIGGISVNVIASDYATVYCQSNTQSFSEMVSVPTMAGNKNVSFAWLLGGGIEFKLARGFSIYGEPTYQQSFTAISANTPLSTYPNYLDVAVGVKYHF